MFNKKKRDIEQLINRIEKNLVTVLNNFCVYYPNKNDFIKAKYSNGYLTIPSELYYELKEVVEGMTLDLYELARYNINHTYIKSHYNIINSANKFLECYNTKTHTRYDNDKFYSINDECNLIEHQTGFMLLQQLFPTLLKIRNDK